MIDSGASALHCGRVLALTRGNTGKIRKLFFSDSMALEDKATVLRRKLSPTDKQQAIRTERFGAEIEKLGELTQNPDFRKRRRRIRKVRQAKIAGR